MEMKKRVKKPNKPTSPIFLLCEEKKVLLNKKPYPITDINERKIKII